MTFHPEASKKTLLALALASMAAGCGDGMDVQLGTAPTLQFAPDGGTPGDGGTGDASGDTDPGNPDSNPGCANGAEILSPMLELLNDSMEPGRNRIGFGRSATGGKGGCVYRVTDYSDGPMRPGTLRYGLESPDRLWIVFDEPGGTIALTDNLRPLSHKTIDGRGASVRLQNYGIEIAGGQENFIIHKLQFVGDPDLAGTEDAITLREGAHTVWIDHCDFSSYRDSLIDVIDGATDVTISWSHFHDQEKVMLLGSENDAEVGPNMRVTLHHNWFHGTYTWHPRARWGLVHEFNNVIEAWGTYGLGPTSNVRVVSEANVYLADSTISTDAIRTTTIDKEEQISQSIWSENDSFRGGATEYVNPAGLTRAAVFEPREQYRYTVSPAKDDDTLLDAVRAAAGAL